MDVAEQQIGAGEQIGPYVVSRRLGAGGMGEVYLARHRHLDRDAAVKVLLPEISMNQTVVARFFTEARATAQLRHPNIVEIFDCDVLPDGRAYIVMEYLRGESLRQTLDRIGRVAPIWTSIAAITGMVADALYAAHESGIVHRDLKPDNTYLTAQRGQRAELTVKVLDFGIAKLLSGGGKTGSSATRTGSLIGTPLYMSPEQCRGVPNIDHRADIYSLGCMVYEMVVGQPPFVAEAPGDILMAHMLQTPPPLRTFDPSVPESIDALVAMMLAKDPAQRPQSMAEVVATCQTLLGVSKAEFASTLRPPPGFPEQVQAATQILPAAATPIQSTPIHVTPLHATPSRQTPPPPRPASTPVTEIEDEVAPPTARGQRTPVRTGTRRAPSADGGGTGQTVAPGSTRPKWLLPVAIIAPLVALGIAGAYLLSRPQPLPPPEPVTKPAPTHEPEPARPGGFVPPSEPTPPPTAAEPRQPQQVAPPEPQRPTDRPGDRKLGKKKAGGGKKTAPSGVGGFKAVGD